MKKYPVFLFVVLFASNIYSQIIQGYGVEFGYVNSGLTYSKSSLNDIISRKSGFSFGIFIELLNTNGLSIAPKVKYIQKGANFESNGNSPVPKPITSSLGHNYISIPISIKYKYSLGTTIPYIGIAPRYDIYVNSKWEDEPSSKIDGLSNVFGGTMSIGLITNLMTINPYLEISYHIDFTELNSNVDTEIGIKNNALEISVGVIL